MEIYWQWLCGIPGLYQKEKGLLLQYFGTPEEVWRASERDCRKFGEAGYGWIQKVEKFRKEQDPESFSHRLERIGIQFISQSRTDYPEKLRRIADAPYGLFYRGSLPAPGAKQIAVVGARMCSRYGKEMAQLVARAVAECGGELVSGCAYGIDGIAQMEALDCGGSSYGILGCGADRVYPSGNRVLFERLEKQGGLISEFPPGTGPLRYHFPLRNRLISGLSDVIVVVEAKRKSGSLITADFAADQGRDVYAVPGRVGDELSEGCNELISQGAGIFLSVKQFRDSVFQVEGDGKRRKSVQHSLAPSEKLVYSSLGFYSKSLSELQECTGLSLDELSTVLLSLEQKGLGRETDRNYYAKME